MADPRPLVGLVAGLAAGLAAAAAMDAFQRLAAPLVESGDGEPSTVKAADAASTAATGMPVRGRYRAAAGETVHYVTGALLGGLYGLATEYWPRARGGFGSGYGVVTSLLLDEAAVPAAGLSLPPTETSIGTHVYGLAAHLVYGVALEATRTLLVGPRPHPARG